MIDLRLNAADVTKEMRRMVLVAPKRARAVYSKALLQVGVELTTEFKREAPRFTGKLANSHGRTLNRERLVLLLFNRAKHALWMHEGTNHSKAPPAAALEKWAQRKLGKAGLGWVVAQSIKRKGGLKARKWMEKRFDKHRQRVLVILDDATRRLVAELQRA